MANSSTEVSLRQVLRRLSTHLETLASDVHVIEITVGTEFDDGNVPGMDGITKLQRLDYLRQSLNDAALLARIAAQNCQGTIPTTTASKLRLETTKNLLGKEPPSPPHLDLAGDVDLF